MKLVTAIVGASTFLASTSHACSILAAHSAFELAKVNDGRVISTMLGPVGELKGNDVYNTSHQYLGSITKHKVSHADGSFAAFVAGGQILDSRSQTVAVATQCTPAEAGAAYLLLFH